MGYSCSNSSPPGFSREPTGVPCARSISIPRQGLRISSVFNRIKKATGFAVINRSAKIATSERFQRRMTATPPLLPVQRTAKKAQNMFVEGEVTSPTPRSISKLETWNLNCLLCLLCHACGTFPFPRRHSPKKAGLPSARGFSKFLISDLKMARASFHHCGYY